ncbi:dihydrofolate reductase family protein [Amnibacterium endophyticum]|uniref:Dihydrofolate reductase family protein n=1 Tax=Amnibacterium endophyticum TaxID=2109337 RepID=A0ABW4LEK3_9MICO
MADLVYFQPCSLDLRIADAHGDFSWAEPTEQVHAFANEVARRTPTQVLGRRMWEVMRFWESMPDEDGVMGEFGRLWRSADKVVVSTTLDAVDTARTELVPRFDADDLRRRKAAATADLAIGGATLAAAALEAGLIDEIHLLVAPVVVGSGPRALPDGVRIDLDLVEPHSFDGGWTSLRHRVRSAR